jgi:hypothetical protein
MGILRMVVSEDLTTEVSDKEILMEVSELKTEQDLKADSVIREVSQDQTIIIHNNLSQEMTEVSETTAEATTTPIVEVVLDLEAVASVEETAAAVDLDPAAVAVASEVVDNFQINNYSKK